VLIVDKAAVAASDSIIDSKKYRNAYHLLEIEPNVLNSF
jgi:hypothetical protein